jgi:hypothetical protein
VLAVTLMVITLTLLWLGWDGWRQAKQIAALELEVFNLGARIDQLQRRIPVTGKDWSDDDRLTKFNWARPGKF